ncbi:hypothetical protein K431DRAFT_344825 [Polychaeton citri CBS 116435]|uniref:Uncharacterized protein n=1 Tax=Polychaeton citri CBS 116435 TaxID=1314669 RepID=A0A9P4Q9T3_9PEZI|nr:hypothetical protein K431DRAFT_344825 [Polychaeton citri CBS 116435]
MTASTTIYGTIGVLILLLGGYIYVFGLPPEIKRKLEEEALDKMGENKSSYMMKDTIGKIPTSDQKDVQDVKKGLANAVGGSLQNPLGKAAGNTADDATRDFTGR